MMMGRLTALLLVIAGTAAAEGDPIVGTYADEGGCSRIAGEPASSDMVFILTPERVERYESSCDISTVTVVEGFPTQLDVTCVGEGEEWTDSYVIAPLKGVDGFLIGPLDYPDISFEVRRCN